MYASALRAEVALPEPVQMQHERPRVQASLAAVLAVVWNYLCGKHASQPMKDTTHGY